MRIWTKEDIDKIGISWRETVEQELKEAFLGERVTATSSNESSVNIEDLEKVIEKLYPPLYYATDKNLEQGTCYLVNETDFHPEFVILHPDDFEEFSFAIKNDNYHRHRKFLHIRDEPKEKQLERIIKNSTREKLEKL